MSFASEATRVVVPTASAIPSGHDICPMQDVLMQFLLLSSVERCCCA